MIYRGMTFPLEARPDQIDLMGQYAGVCRLVWNLCLEQRRDWHRQFQKNTGDNLNWVTQGKELTLLRKEFDFVKQCPQQCAQRVIANLDRAFRDFFRAGKAYPKFKKKSEQPTISFQGRSVLIEKINDKWSRVSLPKLGWIKFRQTRPIEGKVFDATVSQSAKGWEISFGCKIDNDLVDVGGAVGIDRGVNIPVALSDGQTFTLPTSLDKVDRQIRKAQSIASRRSRGSNRHAKAQRRVSNLSARKARIRKNWAHKTTTDITSRYGTVVIERLRTKDMTQSAKGTVENPGKSVAQKRGLNRAILNVGWFQIEQMLSYKSFKLIKINPAYTSQCCSACGVIDKRSRKSQADFQCVECGFEANADHNAAINILNRGNTAVLDVEGSGYRPCEASTADKATVA